METETNSRNELDLDQEISTPKESSFKILPQCKTIFMHSSFEFQKDKAIEDDTQFILELFQIIEKQRKIQHCDLENQESDQILSDQLCEKIHQIALRHGAAKKFNIFSELQQTQIPVQNLCECGCLKAEGDPLPFCTNEVEKYFFGPAIILFFLSLKKVSLLVFIVFMVYGIFGLTSNIIVTPQISNQCEQNPGAIFFFCQFKYYTSLKVKANMVNLMTAQVWLGFLFCIIWMIGIRIIRNKGRKLKAKVDKNLQSSSDYVIQLRNLPSGKYSQRDLLKYIAGLWKKYNGSKPLYIKSVQIVYSLSKPRYLIKQIITAAFKLISKLQRYESKKYKNSSLPRVMTTKYFIKGNRIRYFQIKYRLLALCKEIQKFRNNFINDTNLRSQLAGDMAFIQFKYSNDQAQFLEIIPQQPRLTIFGELKEKLCNYFFPSPNLFSFKGSSIKIMRAPEPSDVHWNNCENSFSFRRIIFVWFLTIMILVVSFAVLLFIGYLRNNSPNRNILALIISISLLIFNRIIWNCLCSFVKMQKNYTQTDDIISVMTKSAFATAMNNTILPLISKLVLFNQLYQAGGLVGIVLDFQFMTFFMMLALNVVNFPYLFQRLTICIPCVRNYLIRHNGYIIGNLDSDQNIRDVLEMYDPPAFPVASAYTNLITIIFQATFFCHIQPALLILCLFNLASFYLVLKYLLIRRCRIPQLFDSLLFQTFFSILQYVPFLYGIGSLIFIQIMTNSDQQKIFLSIPSILCIFIWFIDVFNPKLIMNKITLILVKLFFENKEKQSEYKETNVIDKKKENKKQKKERLFLRKSLAESFHSEWFLANIKTNNDAIARRRESYYMQSGLNDILNYQLKLFVLDQDSNIQSFEKRNKFFCERFQIDSKKDHPKSIPSTNTQVYSLKTSIFWKNWENIGDQGNQDRDQIFCKVFPQNSLFETKVQRKMGSPFQKQLMFSFSDVDEENIKDEEEEPQKGDISIPNFDKLVANSIFSKK